MSKCDDSSELKYCSDFMCTYHLHDLEDQDDMYKYQMLQAFMIDEWDNEIVNKTVRILFKDITDDSNPYYIENMAQLERLFEKMEYYLFPENYLKNGTLETKVDKQIFLFQYLFVFDYFFKTHELICIFLNGKGKNNKKIVSEKTINDLIKLFSNNEWNK